MDLHLSLIMAYECAAMCLNNGCQGRSIKRSTGHPGRKLLVPDTVVTLRKNDLVLVRLTELSSHTSEKLPVALGEICDHVSLSEREDSLFRLSRIL